MNYQEPADQTWQQQPVYQQQNSYQQPFYQQQPVYQQQNPYQQAEQPVNQTPEQPFSGADASQEAFAPQAEPQNQPAADGEKKDVDVTMVEL